MTAESWRFLFTPEQISWCYANALPEWFICCKSRWDPVTLQWIYAARAFWRRRMVSPMNWTSRCEWLRQKRIAIVHAIARVQLIADEWTLHVIYACVLCHASESFSAKPKQCLLYSTDRTINLQLKTTITVRRLLTIALIMNLKQSLKF